MNHFDNQIIEIIFIILHFLLFVLNFKIMQRNLMNPAVIFSFLWFVVLLLHFIFSLTVLDELFPVSPDVFIIFFIGTISFSLGVFLQTGLVQKAPKKLLKNVSVENNRDGILSGVRYFLVAIILIGLPFYIMASYQVYLVSNIENFLVGLRTELTYGDESLGPVVYLQSFAFIVLAINLYSYFTDKSKRNQILLILTIIIVLGYTILSTGRGLFLLILILYAGIAYLHKKNFSFKRIARLGAFFLILFMIIGLIYGKGGDSDDSLKENIRPMIENTAIYIVTPINALDYGLHNQFSINHRGNNTLRFFTKIAEKLNLMPNLEVSDLVQPFVYVPYPTNVYTIYDAYIKDFGRLYAWLMVFIFGFIHSYFFNKAMSTKKLRFTLYYSFLLFPLIMSFFQDQYLSLTSTWLQFIFYIEVILFMNKILKREIILYKDRAINRVAISNE